MITKQSSRRFYSLAVASAAELIFGRAPQPVTCGHGLAVGADEVYPEINFTLSTMLLEACTWPAVLRAVSRDWRNDRARQLAGGCICPA